MIGLVVQPYHDPVQVFRVHGGGRLSGEVRVPGARSSVLALMAAALLAEGSTTLLEVPRIADVAAMASLLRRLGCQVESVGDQVTITTPARPATHLPAEVLRRSQAAVKVLGPLVARCGEARLALPSGDRMGRRALDLRIAGLERMGAVVYSQRGYLVATAGALAGVSVWLEFPSVGATENLLTAAVLAKGTTVIENAAREPEIVDLARLLTAMGARIDGAGSSVLVVEGVEQLGPTTHTVLPDRIVAGTWAIGAAVTRGEVLVRNGVPGHLEILLDKLTTAGADVTATADGFRVVMDRRPRAVDVVTLPYPGIPTELQPMMLTLAAVCDGAAMITDSIVEARSLFKQELTRLAADLRADGHHVVVRGRLRLSGTAVRCGDMRTGAALVLAGLVADGVTEVAGIDNIDRGYAGFEHDLARLRVRVDRIEPA